MGKVLINLKKKENIHYTVLYIFIIFYIFKYSNYNNRILNYYFLYLNVNRNSLIINNFNNNKEFYYFYCILTLKYYKNIFNKFKLTPYKNNKILLFLECKSKNLLNITSTFLFKNLNQNQLFFFDSFSLRIEFPYFFFFRKYLEYFRLVKYNEYLTFNKRILKKKKLRYFLRKALIKGSLFKNFRASLIAKKILMYKPIINNIVTDIKINYTLSELQSMLSSLKNLILLNHLWPLKFIYFFKKALQLYLYFWMNNYIQVLHHLYIYQRVTSYTLKENYFGMITANFNFFDIYYQKFLYVNIKNLALFNFHYKEYHNLFNILSLFIIDYIDKSFFNIQQELNYEEYDLSYYTLKMWSLIKNKFMFKFIIIFNAYSDNTNLIKLFKIIKYTLDVFILKVFDFTYLNNDWDWDQYYFNHINLIDNCCSITTYIFNIYMFIFSHHLNKYLFIFQNFYIYLNSDLLIKNKIIQSFLINVENKKAIKLLQYKYFYNQHKHLQNYQTFFTYYNNNLEYYYKPTGYFRNRIYLESVD